MRSPARTVAATLAGLFGALGLQTSSVAQPAPPAVVIEGRGWGHGVGMAQDGALSMGRAGASTADILSRFYPGTVLGRAAGVVRVEVEGDAGPASVLELPDGGEVRDGPAGSQSAGFPVAVPPGGRVELSFDGTTYRARPLADMGSTPAVGRTSAGSSGGIVLLATEPSSQAPPSTLPATTSTTVPTVGAPAGPSPRSTVPPAPASDPTSPPVGQAPAPAAEPLPPPPPAEPSSTNGLWVVPSEGSTVGVAARDRSYRGVVRAGGGPGGLRLVNELDVEEYLRGMGEVRDPSWPAASLGAQAVASRTYALRAMAGGGDICDTEQCQVYLGQAAEYGAMDRAVAETRGQVVTAGGGLALTVYSANAGGVSATPEEGFGSDGRGYPYLVASAYASADPQPWTVQVSPAELGRRLGYAGELTEVRVSRSGPSGRALEVSLEGSAGSMPVDGLRFMSESRLRSNLFTLRLVRAEPVPEQAVADRGPGPGSRTAAAVLPLADPVVDRRRLIDGAPWEAIVVVVVALAFLRRRSQLGVASAAAEESIG